MNIIEILRDRAKKYFGSARPAKQPTCQPMLLALEDRTVPTVMSLTKINGYDFRPVDVGVSAQVRYIAGDLVDPAGTIVASGVAKVTPDNQMTWMPVGGATQGLRLSGISPNGQWLAGSAVTGALGANTEGLLWNIADLAHPYHIGGTIESTLYDVSSNGVAVGSSQGSLTAVHFSVSTGLVALPSGFGSIATSVDEGGTVFGGLGLNEQGNVQALSWTGEVRSYLSDPFLLNSRVDAESPNGRVLGGSVSFLDFTDFKTKEQAAVWVDGVLTLITNPDGTPYFGRVLSVTDDVDCFGLAHDGDQLSTNTRGFAWNPSYVGGSSPFNGPQTFDSWLGVVSSGDTLATPSVRISGVFEDPITHQQTFAVNGSAYLVVVGQGDPPPPPTTQVVVGTNGNNTLVVDVLGTTTEVLVQGLGGNDTIIVRPAAGVTLHPSLVVRVEGGAGNDTVTMYLPGTVDLGDGNDRLCVYSNGAITVTGGAGNDEVYVALGFSPNVAFDGGNGNDVFTGRGRDTFNGGAGNDYAWLYGASGMADLGAGNDTATIANNGVFTILGGDGNDQTIVLNGFAPDVTFDGGNGSDVLFGRGRTRFTGGNGDDVAYLYGLFNDVDLGAGNDLVHVLNNGTNNVKGGTGNDRVIVGCNSANVVFDGGDGADYFYGGYGSNVFLGGAGNDYYVGIGGNNVLFGEAGNDTFIVLFGRAIISGGAGDDHIIALVSDCLIDGGAGKDYITVVWSSARVVRDTKDRVCGWWVTWVNAGYWNTAIAAPLYDITNRGFRNPLW